MYSAIGLGAPIGLAVYASIGFAGVGVLAAISPLIALGIASAIPDVPVSGSTERTPFYKVIGLIWRSGTVLFLATIPFAGITGFLALTYVERGWSGAGIALAAFSTGFICRAPGRQPPARPVRRRARRDGVVGDRGARPGADLAVRRVRCSHCSARWSPASDSR